MRPNGPQMRALCRTEARRGRSAPATKDASTRLLAAATAALASVCRNLLTLSTERARSRVVNHASNGARAACCCSYDCSSRLREARASVETLGPAAVAEAFLQQPRAGSEKLCLRPRTNERFLSKSNQRAPPQNSHSRSSSDANETALARSLSLSPDLSAPGARFACARRTAAVAG